MTRPDYLGGSLVNLMRSLEVGLGAAPYGGPTRDHPTLGLLPPETVAARPRVVVLLIDGLGDAQLRQHAPRGALAVHRRGTITSVFPSTTASAVTTLMTGLPPGRHGVTGWHLWLEEAGMVVASLPFKSRVGGRDLEAEGVDPMAVFDAAPFPDRVVVECCTLLPEALTASAYTRAHQGRARVQGYRDLEGFLVAIESFMAGPGGGYLYAYWPELDALSHRHGAGSARAGRHLRTLDAGFARLLEAPGARETTLVATADHGFVDTRPETRLQLEGYPQLARLLRLPLCGEPRVAWCYLHPGQEERFLALAEEHLDGACRAVPSRRMVAEGWFGGGPVHPALASRLGDVALVLQEDYSLHDRLPGERTDPPLIGVHGGASEAEMQVPLIMVQP